MVFLPNHSNRGHLHDHQEVKQNLCIPRLPTEHPDMVRALRSSQHCQAEGRDRPVPHLRPVQGPKFRLCRSCNAASKNQTTSDTPLSKYEPESNPKWDAADQEDDVFFIYILKLDGGKFYAGHTRELRERMGEHRDGKTRSTAGKNPLLVWFDVVDTREEAAKGEAYMKELIDRNEREVRRMVNEFQDLISLIHLESNRSDSASRAGSSANKTAYQPPRFGYRRQAAR